ncbi:MAG: YceI family protein, partial [bacterium]
QDPWGNTRLGVEADLTIDRQDYGVSWNKTLDTGGLVVSDEVNIKLDVELQKEG